MYIFAYVFVLVRKICSFLHMFIMTALPWVYVCLYIFLYDFPVWILYDIMCKQTSIHIYVCNDVLVLSVLFCGFLFLIFFRSICIFWCIYLCICFYFRVNVSTIFFYFIVHILSLNIYVKVCTHTLFVMPGVEGFIFNINI